MTTRHRWTTAGACAISLAAGLVWTHLRDGPRFEGKSVRRWFQQYYASGSFAGRSDEAAREEAVEALGALGTNAAVYLVEEALRERRDSVLAQPFHELWIKLHPAAPPYVNAEGIAMEAGLALREIRPPARIVLPRLSAALRGDDQFQYRQALFILGCLEDGAEVGLPHLIRALQRGGAWEREIAAQSLKSLGLRARSVLPEMIDALPRRPCPAYLIWAVGSFGPEASAAIPALETKLADSNPLERMRAAVSLFQIVPNHAKSLEALRGAIAARNDPVSRRAAIWALREIKVSGKDLVPDLREIALAQGGTFTEAAIDALQAIAPDDAVAVLLARLQSDSFRTQVWAAGRILRIQPTNQAALAFLMSEVNPPGRKELRSDVIEQLGETSLEATEAVALLRKVSEDPRDPRRQTARQALQKIKRRAATQRDPDRVP